MKKVIGILMLLGSVNAFAGSTDCGVTVIKNRLVVELRHQQFVTVSAVTKNNCETDLSVRVSGISLEQERNVTFSAIRMDSSIPVPFPVTLDRAKFVRVGHDTIEIVRQLQVGDTLFVRISSFGFLPFVIQ